jgi:hypothetical protein
MAIMALSWPVTSSAVKFAVDSLLEGLEGDGFEPSVPPVTSKQFRRGAFAHQGTAVKIAGSSLKYLHKDTPSGRRSN